MNFHVQRLGLFAAAISSLGPLGRAALPSVGPDYERPAVATPAAYRDADLGRWQAAAPADSAPRGEWWRILGDERLNQLVERALASNHDLHAAVARVEQARAAAGLARANYFPAVAVDASATRSDSPFDRVDLPAHTPATVYNAPAVLSWEFDLAGRVRRLSESARAQAEAVAALHENVRLSLAAEVAATYFTLRALDREISLVSEGVVLRRRALELASARLRSGTGVELEVAQTEAELASTEAEHVALRNRRATLQSGLAVLLGESPTTFALESAPTPIASLAPVPVGLPATLLERRPDIAAAERTLAAANARIGVAKAAFFPAISLTGSGGYASTEVDALFKWDSGAWSIGPSLYLPLFQGGHNKANLRRSRAAYDEAVANYRQQILVAFREVQDALTATRLLAEQSALQDRAVASARRAADLSLKRYEGGLVSYLEVIDSQRTALAAERAAAQLNGYRFTNTIALIKALGGSWATPTETL